VARIEIRTVTTKQYQCCGCGRLKFHSTNHYGFIYPACNQCGGHLWWCREEPPTLEERVGPVELLKAIGNSK